MASQARTWVFLVVGVVLPVAFAGFALLAESKDVRPGFLLGSVVVAAALALRVLRRPSPWRAGHGPAVVVASIVWTVAGFAFAAGDGWGLVILGPPIALAQVALVAAGAIAAARGNMDRAMGLGQVTGLGSAIGIALGAAGFLAGLALD